MYTRFASNLINILGPLIFIGFGLYLAPMTKALPPELASQLIIVPYVPALAAFALGFIYRRHRYIVLALFISFIYWAFLQINQEIPGLNKESVYALSALIGLCLPLNYLYLTRLHDRGLMSMQGIAMVLILGGQMLAAWWIAQNLSQTTNQIFAYELDLIFGFVNRTHIPSISLFVWIIVGVLMLVKFVKTLNVFDSGFLGALVALGLAYNAHTSTVELSFYISMSFVLLIVALVKHTYNLAYIDELTELPGRRALNEELLRLSGTYAIAMLDVDHFKKFNDTHGHDLGDQVLRMVASKLMRISGGGKPFRYGGEEFCVVFHGKTMKEAFPHLSKLRETIDETRMILRSRDRPNKRPDKVTPQKAPWREVHVTISIGVAESSEEFHSTDDVIKAADKALYKAKEKGRNRIHNYQKEVPDAPAPA